MTVALTGANGHIGAALVRQLLEEGHSVRVLVYQDDAALRGLPVERINGNVEDATALLQLCRGAEVVQHLASRISIGEVPERELQRINVLGTKHVLAACRAAGVSRLIYFSSVHAFHAVPVQMVFDESAPPATAFPYERTKAAAQKMVLEAGQAGGLETICLNPTSVLGPWDFKPSLQGQMLLDLYRGKIPLLTPGGFDWVDNRDVAKAAVAAINNGRSGHAYLLSGRFATLLELAALFGQIANCPPPKRVAPFWLLRGIAPLLHSWASVTGQRPMITREALSHVERGHPMVSHAKAKSELGYAPRPLEETLRDTWKWLESAYIRS